jgi:Rps23 Pro-64 3,4-dihydroxylase Tpa1-like proline 4-hydroxylase
MTIAEPSSEVRLKGPMPPYAQFRDFLDDVTHQALLDWVSTQRANFVDATVTKSKAGHGTRLDPEVRIALKLGGLGALEAVLSGRLLEILPDAMASIGSCGPEPRSLELEITAYGDGAHFKPHLDIPIGSGRQPLGARKGEDRVISAVYYFHNHPRGFSGGRLRLFRFGSEPANCAEGDSIVIEPIDNSLVVFPSWAQHGVERVSCSSGDFDDYRYAVNCWYCRPLDGGATSR